jgi:membrane-associated phospholipid phosphatase
MRRSPPGSGAPRLSSVAGLLSLCNRHAAATAAWLVVGLVAGSVIELALKTVMVHPGPAGLFHRVYLPIGIAIVAPYNFPSGHTLRTAMIACVALRRYPWLAAALVVSMMAVLICMGYHWPSEVLGGLCLGWVLVEAGSVIRKSWPLSQE